jgi:hypothetical protein
VLAGDRRTDGTDRCQHLTRIRQPSGTIDDRHDPGTRFHDRCWPSDCGNCSSPGVVERLDGEYILMPAGEDLRAVVFSLGEWGAKWQFGDPREAELDPELLLWWVHDRLDFSGFPARRTVLEFHFSGESRRFWIVKDVSGPSLCTHDPGFDVDVRIDADLAAMYKVWLGRVDLRDAVRAGSVELHGQPALVRRIPCVFLLSLVAPFVVAAR